MNPCKCWSMQRLPCWRTQTRVGWDRGILLKLARSQSCQNTEEEAWGSVRGPRQSLRSTLPACCPWRYTHLQKRGPFTSGPPLTFWWTGQSWNDKPGRIHLWIKTDKQETKTWCFGTRDGSSVFSREHCRSLWMTYSPWFSAPAVQSRWPSNTFLTCWMSRRDNMVSLTQTLYTSGRPTGSSPSSNDVFMGRGVFKQHCGLLCLQSASALLDQHHQKSSVYFWRPGFWPCGRRSLRHFPDFHGLLHHRWAQAGPGESNLDHVKPEKTLLETSCVSVWENMSEWMCNFQGQVNSCDWSGSRSSWVNGIFCLSGLSHQQTAVCQRHPSLQTDGGKVRSPKRSDSNGGFLEIFPTGGPKVFETFEFLSLGFV